MKTLAEKLKEVIDAHQGSDNKEGIIIIDGNSELQKANFKVVGSSMVAVSAITALLEAEHSNMKQFWFSILGSYLSKNQDELDMFLRGIDEVRKFAPGIN